MFQVVSASPAATSRLPPPFSLLYSLTLSVSLTYVSLSLLSSFLSLLSFCLSFSSFSSFSPVLYFTPIPYTLLSLSILPATPS